MSREPGGGNDELGGFSIEDMRIDTNVPLISRILDLHRDHFFLLEAKKSE